MGQSDLIDYILPRGVALFLLWTLLLLLDYYSRGPFDSFFIEYLLKYQSSSFQMNYRHIGKWGLLIQW